MARASRHRPRERCREDRSGGQGCHRHRRGSRHRARDRRDPRRRGRSPSSTSGRIPGCVGGRVRAASWRGQQHRCDVRDAAQIERVVAAVIEASGRVDILSTMPGWRGRWRRCPRPGTNQTGPKGIRCAGPHPHHEAPAPGRIISRVVRGDHAIAGGAAYAASAGVHPRASSRASSGHGTSRSLLPRDDPHRDEPLRRAAPEHQRRLDAPALGRRPGRGQAGVLLASDLAGYITALIDVSGGKLATQIRGWPGSQHPRRATSRSSSSRPSPRARRSSRRRCHLGLRA